MSPTTEALVIIAIIIIAYTCCGLVLQWWSGEVADGTETEHGPDMQEGWTDE